MQRVSGILLLIPVVSCAACRSHRTERGSQTPAPPALQQVTAKSEPTLVSVSQATAKATMQDYDAILERIGWSKSAVGAKTLSPSGNMLVIAAHNPDSPDTEYRASMTETSSPWTAEPNLFLIFRDGTYKQLTTDDGFYADVFFDATETRIAYMSQQGVTANFDASDPEPPVSLALYVQSLRAGTRKKLFEEKPVPLETNAAAFASAATSGWIPGTHDLLYDGARPSAMWAVPDNGDKPRLITSDPPTSKEYDAKRQCWHAQWVDARRHTFQYADVPADVRTLANPTTWQHLNRTQPFYLPGFPESTQLLTYSPDRKRLTALLFCSAIPGGDPERNGHQLLVVLELRTRQVRVVGVAPEGRYGAFGWASDGRHLLCTQTVQDQPNRVYQCDADAVPPQPMRNVNWRYRKPASFAPSQLPYAQ